jgi:hypothetical protein
MLYLEGVNMFTFSSLFYTIIAAPPPASIETKGMLAILYHSRPLPFLQCCFSRGQILIESCRSEGGRPFSCGLMKWSRLIITF